jgi:hypothetical protein
MMVYHQYAVALYIYAVVAKCFDANDADSFVDILPVCAMKVCRCSSLHGFFGSGWTSVTAILILVSDSISAGSVGVWVVIFPSF